MTDQQRDHSYMNKPVAELFRDFPHAAEFFASLGIGLPTDTMTPAEYFDGLAPDFLDDLGLERKSLPEQFAAFLALLDSLSGERGRTRIESITVKGGHDKKGIAEGLEVTVRPGEVICIVGPTGSGKSRFLADIEWLAHGDTPSGRTVLINGELPDPGRRFAVEEKLVAQLSQNMNFVMDLTAEEFVTMHAESRMVENASAVTQTIIDLANDLAGEKFTPQTPVTSLSGGQSRALMIADTACLSTSPIVLIDEIENAGIDRKRAVRTLVDKRKIVMMATHDPVLALMGDRRLVFRDGGIRKVIATTERERANLAVFEEMDARLNAVRNALRNGELIEE